MSGKTIAGPVTMSSSEYNTLTIQRTTTGGNAIIVLIDGNQNGYRFGIETGEGPDANHRLYIQKFQNAGTPIENPTKQFIEYDGDIPAFYKSYQNLAALKGAVGGGVYSEGENIDGVKTAGNYSFIVSAGTSPWGVGYRVNLYVETYLYQTTTNVIQIVWREGQGVYRRLFNGTSWSTWEQYAFDIPSFYKSYSGLAALTQGIGEQSKGASALNGDMNNITPLVLYTLMGTEIQSLSNLPFAGSQNTIYFGSNTRGIQISISYDGSKVSVRSKWDIWRPWVTII